VLSIDIFLTSTIIVCLWVFFFFFPLSLKFLAIKLGLGLYTGFLIFIYLFFLVKSHAARSLEPDGGAAVHLYKQKTINIKYTKKKKKKKKKKNYFPPCSPQRQRTGGAARHNRHLQLTAAVKAASPGCEVGGWFKAFRFFFLIYFFNFNFFIYWYDLTPS
jgi:hypothetical protein